MLLSLAVLAPATACKQGPRADRALEWRHRQALRHELPPGLWNAQVEWDGNSAGYWPILESPEADGLLARGEAAVPELLTLLNDPERFVAAHVVLTKLSGVRYRSFPDWNGLEVNLGADGQTRIDPRQRVTLAERWRRWAHQRPHPETLPPPPAEAP